MTHLFCFGFGYTAAALARRLGKGWTFSGTSRAGLGSQSATVEKFDGSRSEPAVTVMLQGATHLLASIPPGPDADPALLWHADDIAAAPHLRWIGYLSTIGVYGDAGGGWVDETTEPRPGSERAERRRKAEHDWLDLGRRAGKPVMIFRLPGIYGPGRSVLDDVRAGTARRVIKPGQVFNRAHVDDIAAVLAASIERPDAGRIYNISDDAPAPPQDVVAFAAELLGVPPPPAIDFADAELSAMGRSFYSESKRVANQRIKSELGVRLSYPTYREGLTAILRAEQR